LPKCNACCLFGIKQYFWGRLSSFNKPQIAKAKQQTNSKYKNLNRKALGVWGLSVGVCLKFVMFGFWDFVSAPPRVFRLIPFLAGLYLQYLSSWLLPPDILLSLFPKPHHRLDQVQKS